MVSKEAQPSRAVRPGGAHNLLSARMIRFRARHGNRIIAKEYSTDPHTSVMLLSLLQAKSMVEGVRLPTAVIWALGWITSLRSFLGYTEEYRKSKGNNSLVGS